MDSSDIGPGVTVDIQVFSDSEAAAREAASRIAVVARAAVAARGRFTCAISGGRTPWIMLHALAAQEMPWKNIHLFQVDERVAPTGHADRNLTHIREAFQAAARLHPVQIYPMPVELPDLLAAALRYAEDLQRIAGSPAALDLVHLGLGPDGHTASLVPGDPCLEISDRDVAMTGVYLGRRRMTLTYPLLNRSRHILWLITGGDKAGILARLREGDASIPAGRVRRDVAAVITDRAAAEMIREGST